MAEGDSLQEEVVSAMIVSGQEGTMVVAEATGETNSETRVSSQDDPEVQLDATGKVISGLTKMEVEGEEVVRVGQSAHPLPVEG